MTGATGTPAGPGGRPCGAAPALAAVSRRQGADAGHPAAAAASGPRWSGARWRDRPMMPRALWETRKTFLKSLCVRLSVRSSRWWRPAGGAHHARRLPWNGPVELWPARWCAPPMVRGAAAGRPDAGQPAGSAASASASRHDGGESPRASCAAGGPPCASRRVCGPRRRGSGHGLPAGPRVQPPAAPDFPERGVRCCRWRAQR